MKAAITLILAAAMCFGLAVSEALAQQPTEEQRIADQAAARERSIHHMSLSDRAVFLSMENAVLRDRLEKSEKAAKDCKPAAEAPKK